MAASSGTKSTVWTSRRRWFGNLMPMLLWLPPTAAGVIMAFRSGDVMGWPLGLTALGQVLGWLGVNFFGSSQNSQMRAELAVLKADQLPEVPGKGVFVGFATPKFRSALDPHEDVGLIFFLEGRLTYVGERYHLDIPRSTVLKIYRKPNIHTLLGLGGWIAIDGRNGSQDFRVLVEPREKGTGLANRKVAKALLERLRAWQLGPT